jgi:hypothetical protein
MTSTIFWVVLFDSEDGGNTFLWNLHYIVNNGKKWPWSILKCQECGLLVLNPLQFGESPMFRRNISPPSSGSKSKPSKNTTEAVGKQNDSLWDTVSVTSPLTWYVGRSTSCEYQFPGVHLLPCRRTVQHWFPEILTRSPPFWFPQNHHTLPHLFYRFKWKRLRSYLHYCFN